MEYEKVIIYGIIVLYVSLMFMMIFKGYIPFCKFATVYENVSNCFVG